MERPPQDGCGSWGHTSNKVARLCNKYFVGFQHDTHDTASSRSTLPSLCCSIRYRESLVFTEKFQEFSKYKDSPPFGDKRTIGLGLSDIWTRHEEHFISFLMSAFPLLTYFSWFHNEHIFFLSVKKNSILFKLKIRKKTSNQLTASQCYNLTFPCSDCRAKSQSITNCLDLWNIKKISLFFLQVLTGDLVKSRLSSPSFMSNVWKELLPSCFVGINTAISRY